MFDYFESESWAKWSYYLKAIEAGRNPLYRNLVSFVDHVRYMDDYMTNRGLSYKSIRYPSMTIGWQGVSSATSNTLNFVSSNIERLYK